MLTKKTIGFLGAGNMAESLVKGLLGSGKVSPGQIMASDKVKERLISLAERYEIKVYNKNYEVVKGSDIIFIAVKPGDVAGLMREVAPEVEKGKLLVSLAAGVTTGAIGRMLGRPVPVVRAMPNTPAIVLEGAFGLFAGSGVSTEDLKTVEAIFKAVGRVVTVEDESLMDAVTGLSGSGPAYIFLVMDAMVRAGVEAGLPEEDSRALTLQTTLGAAKLAMESGKSLKELIDMVTSPGGTTIEGLKKLGDYRVREAFLEAVRAAIKRSKELSG